MVISRHIKLHAESVGETSRRYCYVVGEDKLKDKLILTAQLHTSKL